MDKENTPLEENGGIQGINSERKHVFPFNYFDLEGGIPKDNPEEQHLLKGLWDFQIGAPKNSLGGNNFLDFKPDLVIEQMQRMKCSLRDFTKERYWSMAKSEAICLGLTNMNQKIVTNHDLCECLSNLKRTPEHEEAVFNALYAWFRNQYFFEKETVDLWAAKMNYGILQGKRTGSQRVKDPVMDRHGFGQIVKDARSDTIKTITRTMEREAGWKVVATNKQSQSEKNQLYEERRATGKTGKYFVVTALTKKVRRKT
jgi:hypothetical protein